jgi:hypothetical protein
VKIQQPYLSIFWKWLRRVEKVYPFLGAHEKVRKPLKKLPGMWATDQGRQNGQLENMIEILRRHAPNSKKPSYSGLHMVSCFNESIDRLCEHLRNAASWRVFRTCHCRRGDSVWLINYNIILLYGIMWQSQILWLGCRNIPGQVNFICPYKVVKTWSAIQLYQTVNPDTVTRSVSTKILSVHGWHLDFEQVPNLEVVLSQDILQNP